jgi:thiamine pyrophosphokinase
LPETKRAAIFANGALSDPAAARAALAPGDLVIAADGGARHCRALGIMPDYLIGDFDSLEPSEVEQFAGDGVTILRHPERKDFTDLELAIRHAHSLEMNEILVLGALGLRWDQTLANLLLPAAREYAGLQMRLLDGAQEVLLLRGGNQLTLHGQPGDTVSLIPLGGDAHGITTHGLEYPLQQETLQFGTTRGVSNALLSDSATVQLGQGMLLCVLIHLRNAPE